MFQHAFDDFDPEKGRIKDIRCEILRMNANTKFCIENSTQSPILLHTNLSGRKDREIKTLGCFKGITKISNITILRWTGDNRLHI